VGERGGNLSIFSFHSTSECAGLKGKAWLQDRGGTSNPENVAREKEEMEAKIQEVQEEMEPRNAKILDIQAKINDIEDKIFANLSEKVTLCRQELGAHKHLPPSYQADAGHSTLQQHSARLKSTLIPLMIDTNDCCITRSSLSPLFPPPHSPCSSSHDQLVNHCMNASPPPL